MNRILTTSCICITLLLSCKNEKPINEVWYKSEKLHLKKSNIEYIFSAEVDLNTRLKFINRCEKGIVENLELLQEEFKDTIYVEFLKDKKEMKQYTGRGVNGLAMIENKATFMILREEAPIKHELMHMISNLNWCYPQPSSLWMSEGLAMNGTLYKGLSMEEIYLYMLENNKLIPMSKLTVNFYSNHEVVSYYQCGYLVEDLLKTYGLKKFKDLWNKGFNSFESVYGISFTTYIEKKNNLLEIKYSKKPVVLDWESFYNM